MTALNREWFDNLFDEDTAKVWHDVLSFQCTLFSPGEIAILKELGMSKESGPLLDLGCGIGIYSRELKKHFPGLEIVAADTNAALLRRFEADIKRLRLCGIRVAKWNAGKEPPPPEVSKCRSALLSVVLQHNQDPKSVLVALRKSLPSRASVFIIDEDDGLVLSDPSCAAFKKVLDAFSTYQAAHGGTRTFGRQIPRLARQAGLIVDDARICAHASGTLGLEPLFKLFKLALPLIVDGSPHGLRREAAKELARGLDLYVEAHGDHCSIIFPKVIVHAVVP